MKYNVRLFFVFFVLFFSPILSNDLLFDESDYLFRAIDLGLSEPISADISFCIADLKFDGQNLKICEFGEGCHSKFRGFDKLYGKGYAWALFWTYLSRFDLPIWYVGVGNDKSFKEEIAYDTFAKCNGEVLDSFEHLQRNKKFLNSVGRGKIEAPSNIANYKAIICVKSINKTVKSFLDKYPNVLVWDIATAPFVSSKHKTTLLFDNDELLKYRPKFWLIKRGSDYPNYYAYVKSAATKIISECKAKHYVIKPISGTMGNGILIVPEKNLEKTLQIALKGASPYRKKTKSNDKNLDYWNTTKSKYCLVEEFCESKTIVADDIPYDATMRVIFVLTYSQYKPKIDILGAYWKTPPLALNESGNFIDKHKSHAAKQKYTALPVDQDDLQKVNELMQQFMPKIYAKMLDRGRMMLDFLSS